jgi:multidrug efflux pump subunit AcrA (membrane-fusion protein)
MDNNPEVVEVNKGTPGWLVPAVVILAIVSIAGLGFAWYDSNQLQMAQQASGQLKTAEQNTTQLVVTLEQKQAQADAANTELRSNLGVVTKRLGLTQGELKKARDEAAQVAAQVRDEDAQKLARLDTDVKNQLATKVSTDEMNKDLTTVNGNVNGVKTDLEGTKNDLKMARSELGTLIARNHDEIDVLRRMGERDYVEFTVQGRNKPQKIGTVTVELRSVNPKKNQFSVVLVVDDVRTENKNRLSNQPIVFYRHGTHQADEFVVNTVGKDQISGYISIPKSPVSTTIATALGD